MKVLLINPNDEIKKSYVAMSVNVGSKNDPKEFQGFTHLIEHLFFTGSEKFPD